MVRHEEDNGDWWVALLCPKSLEVIESVGKVGDEYVLLDCCGHCMAVSLDLEGILRVIRTRR